MHFVCESYSLPLASTANMHQVKTNCNSLTRYDTHVILVPVLHINSHLVLAFLSPNIKKNNLYWLMRSKNGKIGDANSKEIPFLGLNKPIFVNKCKAVACMSSQLQCIFFYWTVILLILLWRIIWYEMNRRRWSMQPESIRRCLEKVHFKVPPERVKWIG